MRKVQRFLAIPLLAVLSWASWAQTGSRAVPGGQVTTLPARVAPATESGNLRVTTLSEGFDDITLLAGQGWALQNNSQPIGTIGWFQGNDAVFPAQTGAPTAYIGTNFNNTAGTGTISNWLVTPLLDFGTATTFTFFTRGPAGSTFPDRLEVRLSTNGTSTNVGTLATDVGDFTTLLLAINPTLASGGYPQAWTQFTITNAEGIPVTGTGRIAFRYFVTNGGPTGANSDYIGIDTVAYNAGPPAFEVGGNVSGLAGSGLTLTLNGGTPLPIAADGAFTFPDALASGSPYTVLVGQQPTNLSQTCSVTNGTGTITADVTDVQVTCVTNSFFIGGTVAGLEGDGLVLQLNAGETLPVAADGAFAFVGALTDGSSYTVTVQTDPSLPAQTCGVTDGSGTVAGADVASVMVDCVTGDFSLSILGGGVQSADFGQAFADLLEVEVRDADNALLQGVDVTFTAPASGPSAVLDDGVQPGANVLTVQTDALGVAFVSATANNEQGCYPVEASSPGASTTVLFGLTNINPVPEIFADGFEVPPPPALTSKGAVVCP